VDGRISQHRPVNPNHQQPTIPPKRCVVCGTHSAEPHATTVPAAPIQLPRRMTITIQPYTEGLSRCCRPWSGRVPHMDTPGFACMLMSCPSAKLGRLVARLTLLPVTALLLTMSASLAPGRLLGGKDRAELEPQGGVPRFNDRVVQRSGLAHGLADAEPTAGSLE
jgi:hypothetical protein